MRSNIAARRSSARRVRAASPPRAAMTGKAISWSSSMKVSWSFSAVLPVVPTFVIQSAIWGLRGFSPVLSFP